MINGDKPIINLNSLIIKLEGVSANTDLAHLVMATGSEISSPKMSNK